MERYALVFRQMGASYQLQSPQSNVGPFVLYVGRQRVHVNADCSVCLWGEQGEGPCLVPSDACIKLVTNVTTFANLGVVHEGLVSLLPVLYHR
jgi:hypothetical protein